jgi:death on curing protein
MEHGGLPGIRDLGLLESAIGRPYTGYYSRIHHKAAALTESLVLNHGFADGNKRTAFLIVQLLIRRSGYELIGLTGNPFVELENLILQIAKVHPPRQELVQWFRDRLRKK